MTAIIMFVPSVGRSGENGPAANRCASHSYGNIGRTPALTARSCWESSTRLVTNLPKIGVKLSRTAGPRPTAGV